MRGRSHIERRILIAGIVAAVASGVVAGRISGRYGDRTDVDYRVRRVYDPATRRLTFIAFDSDGDLKFDTWSYMDNERAVRVEIDDDQDGTIDRRQYLAADETVERTEFLGPDGRVLRTESPP